MARAVVFPMQAGVSPMPVWMRGEARPDEVKGNDEGMGNRDALNAPFGFFAADLKRGSHSFRTTRL